MPSPNGVTVDSIRQGSNPFLHSVSPQCTGTQSGTLPIPVAMKSSTTQGNVMRSVHSEKNCRPCRDDDGVAVPPNIPRRKNDGNDGNDGNEKNDDDGTAATSAPPPDPSMASGSSAATTFCS